MSEIVTVFDSLRDLQDNTKQGDILQELYSDREWRKDEFAWWRSSDGWHVTGEYFFGNGLDSHEVTVHAFLTKEPKLWT